MINKDVKSNFHWHKINLSELGCLWEGFLNLVFMGGVGVDCRKAPFQILSAVAWVCTAGWTLGCCPPGPAAEAGFMRPSFIAQILIVSVVSYCLCELQASLLFLSAARAKERQKQPTLGTSMLKNSGKWGRLRTLDTQPKNRSKRGGKARSSVSRPLEQSAAADPSETPVVGWRDVNQ